MNSREKIKRILSLLLVAVMATSLLSGCGAKKASESNKTDKEVEKVEEKKPEFQLIANGATEYVIVRGEAASSAEIHAAEELQKYLELISGAKLSIVIDSSEVAAKEIIVGKTNREAEGDFNREELGEDGLVIKTKDSKLWLVGGGDRGTVYSVYTFLEDYLGCRFFTRYIEQVPEMETVVFEEIEEDKQIPQFKYRDVAWADYALEEISAKRKINFALWDRPLSDKVGGGYSYTYGTGGHTFEALVSPTKYFESHPEYFSMDAEGKRISDGQLCLTNPEVFKIVVEEARRWLTEEKDADIISISQNDRLNPCLCPDCKKVYEEEGGAFSGAVIRFVNAVAEELGDEFPDVMFDTYAYQYTRSAPKTKPADNVVIRIPTIECCFSHPHDKECDHRYTPSYLDGSANTYAKDLEEWGKLCNGNLWVYDYTCNFSFSNMTFPDFDNLLANYRWYADNDIVGIVPEGQWKTLSVEFGELRSYLLSKLAWNPYMSEKEYNTHMNEFLAAVYGPGGKYIRDYIELAQELTDDIHFSIGLPTDVYTMYPLTTAAKHDTDELPDDLTVDMVKNYQKTNWEKYWNWYSDLKENRITSEGEKLFEKAIELAETDSQRQELEKISSQVKNIKSYYYAQRLAQGEGAISKLITQFIKTHSKDFSEGEKTTLPAEIEKFAYEQCAATYAKYNRELCYQMVDWGATYGDSSISLYEYLNFDYTFMPALWQPIGGVEVPENSIDAVSNDLAKITVSGLPVAKFRKLEVGASQFSDVAGFVFDVAVPKGLEGASYLFGPQKSTKLKITVEEDGWIYVLTQSLFGERVPLRKQGFTTVETYPKGTLSKAFSVVPSVLMGKEVKAGDTIVFDTGAWATVIAEEASK